MKYDKKKLIYKNLANLLILTFTAGPLINAHAALTLLADEPVSSVGTVRANLMFTLDNSGSMDFDFLGDYAGGEAFCKDSDDSGTGLDTCFLGDPPYNSSASNHIYYDPEVYYQPGVDATGTSKTIQNRANTTTWTRVKSDGYIGTATDDITNTPDTLWCTSSSPSSADQLNPAKCRLNGRAYSAVGSGSTAAAAVVAGYNYPNTSDASGAKFGANITTTSAPYYYTLTSVQYCTSSISSGTSVVNQGFGRSGTCVDKWFSGSKVKYGTGADTASFATAFTRVDIVPTRLSYPKGAGRTDCAGATCTYDEEMTNFANWWAYYRTRMQAMKSAAGIAFSKLDATKFKVGFHTINSPGSFFLPVKDFDNTTNKTNWYAKFYSVSPSGGTPSRAATQRIGEYYKTGILPGLSASASGPDPITASCQLNFHFLSTDGYWNESYTSSPTIGNVDNIVPTLPAPVASLTAGQPWPVPYRQSTTAPTGAEINTDTLSDVATYYWVNDLRPSIDNRVPASGDDEATWQHMVTYGIALGAEGTLPFRLGPPATPFTWPNPVNNSPSAIDDLWHASVNSRGKFFTATTGAGLAKDMIQALDSISQVVGASAKAVVDNADLSTGSSSIYSVGFSAGWAGKLEKNDIDSVTGLKSTTIWKAKDQLTAQAAGTGWNTNRKIATRNSAGAAVPFQFASLSTSQQTAIGDIETLNFLRGDKSLEGNGTTSSTANRFRVRDGVLGDIIGSEAVPVIPPKRTYLDSNDPGYSTFKSTNSARPSMVYVGANDGMLHAFDDTTGDERWAYVPGLMFKTGSAGLNQLAYRVGGLPQFDHRYYVDGKPSVGDVDFNRTNGGTTSGDWRTILVGGLNKGGYGYYALDITSAAAPASETAVASKALWEFTDSDMGYSFGNPTIVKTYAYGWVVLVTSGYNNASGIGYLYVLDAKTGTLLRKLSTGVGTASNPSGLAKITGYSITHENNYVEQVYGGDLLGNLWRFDLSSPNPTSWRVDLLAKFENPSGTPQPITVAPQIEVDPFNDVDRWVFVGTGRLLDNTDYANTQTQSLYGIRDGSKSLPGTISATVTRSLLGSISGLSTGTATTKGWYRDLDPGEQVSKDIIADLGVAVFSTSLPPGSDPCSPNPGRVYVLLYSNGVPSDGTNSVPYTQIDAGIAGAQMVKLSDGSIAINITTNSGGQVVIKPQIPNPSGVGNRVNWREIPAE